MSGYSATTCQALRTYLEEQIEAEEGLAWEDEDMQEDVRDQLIKERDINILRLNQLLTLVHASYQEAQ